MAPLVIRRRWRRRVPSPLPLAIEDRSDIQEAHDGRDDGVRNDAAAPCSCQLQPKTTVYHAKHDGDAADTNVGEGDGCATAILLEVAVVQETADWLREEEDEEHDADDGVGVCEVLAVDGDPDAHAEGHDVDEEADHLESGVNPDKAGEAGCSDQDATDGEEAEECKGCHHAVGEEDGVAVGAEGTVAAVLG